MVGDWSGDDVGTSVARQLTRRGGRRGVVAYRSASTCSGSISIALAFSMSMGAGLGELLSIDSLFTGAGDECSSCRSTVEGRWMEPASDDERVEGTIDGGALRDALLKLELRSLTLREKDEKRRSSLPVMLFAEVSSDRRRLAWRNSKSQ